MSAEPNIPPTDLDFLHLQTELARIDVFIRREVRRWQLAGQNPEDPFRGLHLSDAYIDRLVARPFATSWGQSVQMDPAEAGSFLQAEASAQQQIEAVLRQAQAQGRQTRWQSLTTMFNLTRFEQDALLVCLAPALDSRYEQLYAYLQDDVTRKHPRLNLILDLLCEPGPHRLPQMAFFADEAPLFRHRLLVPIPENGNDHLPLLSRPLMADNTIVAWLLGFYQPPSALAANVRLLQPQACQTDDLLAGPFRAEFSRMAEFSPPPVFAFYGPDRTAQDSAARWLAGQFRRPLLQVDLAGAVTAGSGASPRDLVRLALRDARLTGALPYLVNWDLFLPAEHRSLDAQPVLAEIFSFPGPVIMAGQKKRPAEGVERSRLLFWQEFPLPTVQQRLMLWRHFIGPEADTLAPADSAPGQTNGLAALADQFTLTGGQIKDAVVTARDMATRRGRSLRLEDLFAAARSHSNPNLSTLARKIRPRYSWSDIILPPDSLAVLREIVSCVQQRPVVLDEWGVGRKLVASRGVTVLFVGEPGTGKTMAAEVIAAELGLDLYKIDLSGVVSKYIGETEKNLERIFNEAQTSNAILFFDEADAIFGKRSEVKDAHDRYANIEVSYLLQRMEAYDGVTILATNLRANLDEAFTRRLQFVVDFPFPDETYRLKIWQTLFPPETPRADNLDLPLLARRFKLAGGNIRNVIVSAAYLAAADGRQVTMAHLLHGLRRELQKMGRLVDEADLRLEDDKGETP
ncbi:MAG: ATP-binding protein [Chloroflexi bacterium]|nr:MAG: ATP-binding protein [Chloroflexota bacterium]